MNQILFLLENPKIIVIVYSSVFCWAEQALRISQDRLHERRISIDLAVVTGMLRRSLS